MKTTKRFEYKYIISYVDYFNIRESINQLMIHDQHGEEKEYPVTSIYLDDLLYSGASDKAFGNEVHQKYRIRYYDNSENKKLELKKKVGDESTKYSTPITEELFQGIINQDLDVLHQHFDDELIRKFTIDFLKFNHMPILIVEYQREAFKDESNNLRITFDHSLCADRYSEDFEDINFKLLHDTNLILEIKYEHFLPTYIKKILNKIKLNQIAYSKYFMAFSKFDF